MLFKTFIQKLYRAIGNEGTQAEFVFDVLSSVISDKHVKKDQILAKTYSCGGRMFRYYFDGTKSISNLARKIIRYVDPRSFEWFYNDKFEGQNELIDNVINEFSDEIPEIDNNNYAFELGKLLVNILFEATKKGIKIEESEYNKLRHSLYIESEGICQITGKKLEISGDNAFKIVKIDKDLPFNFDNTLPISPIANPTYFYKDSDRNFELFHKIKIELYEKRRIKNLIDDSTYSMKIKNIIDMIKTNPSALDVTLRLNPIEVKEKINPIERIYSKVLPLITDYYSYLRDLFKEKDGNDFNFDKLCKAIRQNYLKLKKERLSKEKIFDLLSENLYHKIQEDLLACEIIISFFIQNCEVFDEISK